ncbi:twitching motility protein PilT [Luteitalea sp. TBR-22]|uniref:type IV pilus twitching motility protein PilT n=1 Tax=Luteitalea sp. TBR-22 TaxID=2802971 RepID=UPI001AF0DA6B|nr:PilT/PilU family type 4a pilus ATPase [Luteitalea sp. TBR-22]BCS35889.1 twitching motility protein PilT [Luteitalea sp. TBR-22]
MAETDIARLIDELNAQHSTAGDVSARLVSPAVETDADDDVAAADRDQSREEPRRGDAGAGPAPRLEAWLREVVRRQGSDLLLVSQAPPSARVEKRVVPIGEDVLDGAAIERAVLPALPPHAREAYARDGIADASFGLEGVGRFRVNLHRERGRAAATIRALPRAVPRLSSLDLPAQVEQLAHLTRGLVLIGGGTGSGKSTTLAALVDEINRREARHVITIEDPIEYEHAHRRSIVEQVEIGVDAPDYPTALRAALRQMPDVLVVGEMRDPESMRLALTAAETGHLVISTLHTTDVTSTVARIADSFPVERQATIRQEISLALSAVLIQTLLPRRSGGLVPAVELLMVQYGARQHVRKNQLHHLHQEISLTRRFGSVTFEESLATLVRGGHIGMEAALERAAHPEELGRLLEGM